MLTHNAATSLAANSWVFSGCKQLFKDKEERKGNEGDIDEEKWRFPCFLDDTC